MHSIKTAVVAPRVSLDSVEFMCIPQGAFIETYLNIFDLSLSPEVEALKRKISLAGQKLGDRFDITFGLKTGDDPRFLHMGKCSSEDKPLLRGKNIGRYLFEHAGEYVDYRPAAMRRNRTTARPGTRERFEQPKVLVRDTGGKLMAAYEEGKFYVKDVLIVSTKSASEREEALKLACALLNSRVLRYYYDTSFPTLHVQRNELAELPLTLDMSSSCRRQLLRLVDSILGAKAENARADTSRLEHVIDQLVYKLYDLTTNEIAIVEDKIV